MGIESGVTELGNFFNGLELLSANWIVMLLATIFILIIITRDYKAWRWLALPVMIILDVVGLRGNLVLYLFSSIIFIVSLMNETKIGELLSANIVERAVSNAKHKRYANRRIKTEKLFGNEKVNFAKEIAKINKEYQEFKTSESKKRQDIRDRNYVFPKLNEKTENQKQFHPLIIEEERIKER